MAVSSLQTFCRELATLLRATGDLRRALALLGAEGPCAPAAREAAAALELGADAAEALTRALPDLSPAEQARIRAGARAGALEAALEAVAEARGRGAALGRALLRRLLYPLVVLHAAGLVLVFVERAFGGSGLLAGGAYFALLEGLLFAGMRALRPLLRGGEPPPLPGLRGLVRELRAARVAGLLAQLYQAGEPLPAALEEAARSLPPGPDREETLAAAQRLRRGEPLSAALPSVLATPVLAEAVRLGEAAGELAEELLRAARFHEARARERLGHVAGILGWSAYGAAACVVALLAFRVWHQYLALLG